MDAKKYGMDKLEAYNPASPTHDDYADYPSPKQRSPPQHSRNAGAWNEAPFNQTHSHRDYYQEENRDYIRASEKRTEGHLRSPPRGNYRERTSPDRYRENRREKSPRRHSKTRDRSRGRSRERVRSKEGRSGMRSDGVHDLPEPPRRNKEVNLGGKKRENYEKAY